MDFFVSKGISRAEKKRTTITPSREKQFNLEYTRNRIGSSTNQVRKNTFVKGYNVFFNTNTFVTHLTFFFQNKKLTFRKTCFII